jgi:hypothetical protein
MTKTDQKLFGYVLNDIFNPNTFTNYRGLFEDDCFENKSDEVSLILCQKIQATAETLKSLQVNPQLSKSELKKFNKNIRNWAICQIQGLVKKYHQLDIQIGQEEETQIIELIMQTYQCCLPLLIKPNGQDVDQLCRLLHKCDLKSNLENSIPSPVYKKVLQNLEREVQNRLFEHRNEPLQKCIWTKNYNETCFELFCRALAKCPASGLKLNIYDDATKKMEKLLYPGLWKILFHDERAFTLFMRCTNTLVHFSNNLGDLLNTMGRMRNSSEDFLALVRNHYDVIKDQVLPKLDLLGINQGTKILLHQAWDQLQKEFKEQLIVPPSIRPDPKLQVLFQNLYTQQNRRLYPNSFLQLQMGTSLEKAIEAANILQNLTEENVESYKTLLRDPFCTKHAMKAYTENLISHAQFVSICLAWTAVNAYDPKLLTTRIVKCSDPSIRQYYHRNYSTPEEIQNEKSQSNLLTSKNEKLDCVIEDCIALTKASEIHSEQFVFLINMENPSNSELMDITLELIDTINEDHFFFFPNKDHWIVPSLSLIENMLLSEFGTDFVKPIVGFGDFTCKDTHDALLANGRPFQISMSGITNTIYAHKVLTSSMHKLIDSQIQINDPSLWLHDLLHLDIVSAIPKSHRLIFHALAKYLMEQIPLIKSEEKLDNMQRTIERSVDLLFLDYLNSRNNKKVDYKQIFKQAIKKTSEYKDIESLIDEYVKKNNIKEEL